MAETKKDGGEVEGPVAAEEGPAEEPVSDKWAIVIAVILMAVFLTWIGCAIAVYMGWAT